MKSNHPLMTKLLLMTNHPPMTRIEIKTKEKKKVKFFKKKREIMDRVTQLCVMKFWYDEMCSREVSEENEQSKQLCLKQIQEIENKLLSLEIESD